MLAAGLWTSEGWGHAGHGGGGGVSAERSSSRRVLSDEVSWEGRTSFTWRTLQNSVLEDGSLAGFPLGLLGVPVFTVGFGVTHWFDETWGVAVDTSAFWMDGRGLQFELLGRASVASPSRPPQVETGDFSISGIWRGEWPMMGEMAVSVGADILTADLLGISRSGSANAAVTGSSGFGLFGRIEHHVEWEPIFFRVGLSVEQLVGGSVPSGIIFLQSQRRVDVEIRAGWEEVFEGLTVGGVVRTQWGWVREYTPLIFVPGKDLVSVRPGYTTDLLERRTEAGAFIDWEVAPDWLVGVTGWWVIPTWSSFSYQSFALSASLGMPF